MDCWDKKTRSRVMAKIKSRDTKPELIVRKYLYSRGYRFRKNLRSLPGTPDIVMKKYGIAIFVHGCFWHAHYHTHLPSSNIEFWRTKIERTQKRDSENKEKLKMLGWKVMTIWECQLKPSVREKTLMEMEYWINNSYLEQFKMKDTGKIRKPLSEGLKEYLPVPSELSIHIAAENLESYVKE